MIISSAGGRQELQKNPPGLIPPLRRKMNCVFYPKIIKYKKTCRNMDNIQLNILILTRGVMPAGTPHLEAIKDQSIIIGASEGTQIFSSRSSNISRVVLFIK